MVKHDNLNILIVFNSLMGVIGGGSRHIVEVVDYWCDNNKIDYLISQSGYEVAKSHIQKKPSDNKGVILYSTPFDHSKNLFLVYISRIIKNVLMSLKFKRKYDIIIAPNYLPQNMIPAIFFKKSKNTKLVVYFHTTPPFIRKAYISKLSPVRKYISLLNWEICVFLAKRFFQVIFVVNGVTKDYFVKRGIAHDRVFITNNGIDLNLIRSVKVDEKEFDACFLGRLVENKGVFDLVQIWKIVTNQYPQAKLCIIGDGPEKPTLIQKISDEKLDSNIFLAGQKEGKQKYELMKKSKFFVYPSYYESQGVVLLEALSCGLVVLAYDIPIYRDFFEGDIFISELYDIDKFANKLLTLFDDWDEISKIESSSLTCIKKWEDIAEEQLMTFTSNM